MTVYNKVDKIFDEFWERHEYADFHGINIDLLREPLEKLAREIDKQFSTIREEAGDCQGRTGKYVSDLCK